MTKSTATGFLTVVLSSFMLGCAANLPELPQDITYTPEQVQTPASAPQLPVVSPLSNSEVTFEEIKTDIDSDFPLGFVANDLVKALSFISGMEPTQASIRTPTSGSVFDTLVKKAMLQNGYLFDDSFSRSGGLQLTTSFVETNRELQPNELTAIMAINGSLIKRTYLIQNDSVAPKSSYIIRGIAPQLVKSNDQISIL